MIMLISNSVISLATIIILIYFNINMIPLLKTSISFGKVEEELKTRSSSQLTLACSRLAKRFLLSVTFNNRRSLSASD